MSAGRCNDCGETLYFGGAHLCRGGLGELRLTRSLRRARKRQLRVVGVAVRMPDATVFWLPAPARHCHLSATYNAQARADGWDFPWTGWGPGVLDGELGFRLSDGSFADRRRARRVAEAAGQLIARASDGDELFSEDVW